MLHAPVSGQSNKLVSASIEVHKRSIVPGEPLFVSCRFRNLSTQNSVRVYSRGRPPDYILISKDGGENQVWPEHRRRRPRTATYQIIPKSQVKTDYTVVYNTNGLVFPSPGRYLLTVEYMLFSPLTTNRTVVSNSVTVNVSKPTGNDLAVWKMLRNEETYWPFLQSMGTHKTVMKPKVAEKLSEICRQNDKSIYTQYLGYVMGRYYYDAKYPGTFKKVAELLKLAYGRADTDYMRLKIAIERRRLPWDVISP